MAKNDATYVDPAETTLRGYDLEEVPAEEIESVTKRAYTPRFNPFEGLIRDAEIEKVYRIRLHEGDVPSKVISAIQTAGRRTGRKVKVSDRTKGENPYVAIRVVSES